jgi:16S rRNA (cytidine1402-2'-O)-methyltransferase
MVEEVAGLAASLVLYESPRRVHDTLVLLVAVLGGERRAVVARELTKVHEEFVRGTLGELEVRYRGAEVLGEVVLVVEGRRAQVRWSQAEVVKALETGLGRGERLKSLSTELAKEAGWSSQDVYRLGLGLKRA